MFYNHSMSKFISLFRICTVFQIFINTAFTISAQTVFGSPFRAMMRASLTFFLIIFLVVQTKVGLKWNTKINLFIVFNSYINQGIFIIFHLGLNFDTITANYVVLINALYAMSNLLICSSWQCQCLILLGYFI